MIKAETVIAIIETYQKHGWLLRRFLGRSEAAVSFAEIDRSIPVEEFEIEAAWFSREPKAGAVAWEIRYLGDSPFALVESLDEADPAFDESRKAVEIRLKDALKGRLDNRGRRLQTLMY